jgi:Helix-turn-helix domain
VPRPSQDAPAVEPNDVAHRSAGSRGGSEWVSLGVATRILGISEGTLRRWADEGRVAVFTTPGGHRRFSRTMLGALLPAGRAHRPALVPSGGAPERIVQAYRPSAAGAHFGPAWLDELTAEQRQTFRDHGRAIVAELVAYLDARDDETRAARLQEACRLAADHGRRLQALGASLPDAVETFLEFRNPFVQELATMARQRGLDTREATELLMEAESAMDRLLTSMMTGHTLASGSAGRVAESARVDGPAALEGSGHADE